MRRLKPRAVSGLSQHRVAVGGMRLEPNLVFAKNRNGFAVGRTRRFVSFAFHSFSFEKLA
jgi:hypothetical protein